jgi:hypothetical protein
VSEAPKNGTGAAGADAGAAGGQRLQVGIRLQPVDESDQPVFSNVTAVQGAPGMVFLDFGFIEPSAVPAVARLAQTGGKVPEAISGRLACRIAVSLETALQFATQLEQHLRAVAGQRQRTSSTDAPARK